MRLFQRSLLVPNATRLFNEKEFYQAFSKDFKRAKKSIMIESPFVTIRRARELAAISGRVLRKGVDVEIYTRVPLHHEEQLAHQAFEGIEILRKSGVKVISCDDMRHRKIAIIDDEVLWEGSLNMLSHSNSREVMRRTNSRPLCRQMQRFIGSEL